MRYMSTRTPSSKIGTENMSFQEAVLTGWASDGGMILPEIIPQVSLTSLKGFRGKPYTDLCFDLFRLYADEHDLPDLHQLLTEAFSSFGIEEVIKIEQLGPKEDPDSIYVAELWHGPTLAFKDLGMQVLCKIIDYYLKQAGTRMTVLVGTSGDTGPSALNAVASTSSLDCVVLYPLGRISETQEAQMIVDTPKNGHVIAVEGTSDDLDVPCGKVFEDVEFKERHSLGTVNSVNIVRLLVQVFHYFYAYLHVMADHPFWESEEPSDAEQEACTPPTVDFSVPTGAAGHITAGVIAKMMGLPIRRLIAATNANDVFCQFVNESYLQKSSQVHKTISPAMDIQVPYNIERIFSLLLQRDGSRVKLMMDTFYAGELLTLPEEFRLAITSIGLESEAIAEDGEGGIQETMKTVYETLQYLPDPHTAVGLAAVRKIRLKDASDKHYDPVDTPAKKRKVEDNQSNLDKISNSLAAPIICMGCAHPSKFCEAVSTALGFERDQVLDALPNSRHPCVTAVSNLTNKFRKDVSSARSACRLFRQGEDWLQLLKNTITLVTASREIA